MIRRPRATSLRTSSGSIFSRPATKRISSVTAPCRAKCICDMLRLPFSAAAASSLAFNQLSRNAIRPPQRAASETGQRASSDFAVLLNKEELWHPRRGAATGLRIGEGGAKKWREQGRNGGTSKQNKRSTGQI